MYIYPWYISDITATKDLEKIIGCKVEEAFIVIEKDFLSFYYDQNSTTKVGLAIYKKILADKLFFRKVISEIYVLGDELLALGKKIEKIPIKKQSDKEIVSLYEIYIKKLRALRAWGWIPVFLDGLDKSFLSAKVQADLNKFFLKKKIKSSSATAYTILSSSEKMSEVQKEELDRLKFLQKLESGKFGKKIIADIKSGNKADVLKKYPIAAELIKKHLKSYGWLTYAYAGPVMDFDYLFGLLRDNAKDSISSQIAAIENHFNTIEEKKKKLIADLDLPCELVYLFEVSSELMFIKDYRKGVYQKSYVFMDRIMSELAERLKLSLKEIKYLSFNEVKLTLAGRLSEYKEKAKMESQKMLLSR